MTRFVLLVVENRQPGRIAVHGPFRTFAAAEKRTHQFRKRIDDLNIDAVVYIERVAPGSESIADVLEAWHG